MPLIDTKCSDVMRSRWWSTDWSFLEFCIQLDIKGRKTRIEYLIIVIVNFSQQLACSSKILNGTWYCNEMLMNYFISFHWKLMSVSFSVWGKFCFPDQRCRPLASFSKLILFIGVFAHVSWLPFQLLLKKMWEGEEYLFPEGCSKTVVACTILDEWSISIHHKTLSQRKTWEVKIMVNIL